MRNQDPFDVTITVLDQSRQPILDYDGTVTLSTSRIGGTITPIQASGCVEGSKAIRVTTTLAEYDTRLTVTDEESGVSSSIFAPVDTDGDGMTDKFEQENFGHVTDFAAPRDDPDSDGADNFLEFFSGTRVFIPDTDGDGAVDGWEIRHQFNPLASGTNGAIAWYTLDELNGITIEDSLPDAHDGTLIDPTASVTAEAITQVGVFSNALAFDLIENTMVSLSAHDFMHEAFTFRSVSMWVNLNNTDAPQILYDEGGHQHGFALCIQDNNLHFGVSENGTLKSISTTFSGIDRWHHIAAVFDQGTNRLYLDGELKEQDGPIGFLHISFHADGGGFGGRNGQDAFGGSGLGASTHGLIDDVRIFTIALSDAQTEAIYELGPDYDGDGLRSLYESFARTDPFEVDTDGDGIHDPWEIRHGLNPLISGTHNTFRWYKLDELSGTVIEDSGSGSHDGTLIDPSASVTAEAITHAGVFGSAFAFDLIENTIVSLSAHAFMHEAFTSRSVSMWVNLSNVDSTQVLYDEGGHQHGFALRIQDKKLDFGVSENGALKSISAPFTDIDNWHHIAATFNHGINRLYLNGELKGVENPIGFSEVSFHADGGGFGGRNGQDAFGDSGLGASVRGVIDDVRIFSTSISDATVEAIYELGADFDGDGVRTREEYVMLSDPKDAESLFALPKIQVVEANTVITLKNTYGARFYNIEYYEIDEPNGWFELEPMKRGNSGDLTFTDTITGQRRVYRGVVSLP